ncbi:MAG: hypothetical protein Q9226_003216, partial [Calogaya cf. arnoldii]
HTKVGCADEMDLRTMGKQVTGIEVVIKNEEIELALKMPPVRSQKWVDEDDVDESDIRIRRGVRRVRGVRDAWRGRNQDHGKIDHGK